MKDERQSEYIKRVVDFAKYMQKEYIDESGDKCLLISAGDRNVDANKQGIIHAVVGNKEMVIANMVSLMKQKETAEIFRMARIVNSDVDDFTDVINGKRRRLRTLYGLSAISALWVFVIGIFTALGVCNWITTISSLLLMWYFAYLLVREICTLRRQIARLKNDTQEQSKERLTRAFFESLKGMMHDEQDDDK
jgi:hypothetical protein